jgi:HTH-type transcriptional regulator / antitoxin HigA
MIALNYEAAERFAKKYARARSSLALWRDATLSAQKPTPREALIGMMEMNHLKQADIVPIFGSSGITSEVVNGKREISKTHAKKLAKFFHVSTDLFL